MRVSKEEEKALARYFEENRDNPAIWDTKPTKIRARRGGPSAVFSVRFTQEELNLLQAIADGRGITISKLIRDAALREAFASPNEADDLTEAADSLRRIAELISSQAEAPPMGMDERMAKSFVPGKVYTNVPKPLKPDFGGDVPRGKVPVDPRKTPAMLLIEELEGVPIQTLLWTQKTAKLAAKWHVDQSTISLWRRKVREWYGPA